MTTFYRYPTSSSEDNGVSITSTWSFNDSNTSYNNNSYTPIFGVDSHYTLANLEPTTTTTDQVKEGEAKGKKRGRYVRRRALIVGINNYENPNNNLNGCVNDALDMAETLKILQFPPTRIKLLLNEQATTEGILKGLDWLTKDTAENDVLIFHYSGHGSQIPDTTNTEHDKLTEIICPYDINFHGNKYITDDQLFDYFTNKVAKGARVEALLDSCFSGTGTRSFNQINRQGEGAIKQRYLRPPVDHQFRINSMIPSLIEFNYFSKNILEKNTVANQNNVLWAAAQDYQVAWELMLGSEIRGAFTYYFARILRRSNGNVSRGDLYSILRSSMANDGFEQIPALEVPNTESVDIFPFTKESQIDRYSEIKK